MSLIGRLVIVAVLAGSVFNADGPSARTFRLKLVPVETTYRSPSFVADPRDGSGRIFVVELRGVVKIIHDGVPSKHPFLDIRELVNDRGSEQGLLSLAFHPDYVRNATFYAAYTDPSDDLVIARFMARPTRPDRANPESREELLRIDKPFEDHNGGLVLFGPDGYLYIGVGDGGRDSELQNNGQRLDTLLGKLLRIDVDHPSYGRAYGIPSDNPFVGVAGARPEIWAYGLRNPWRFSFDRQTGDLYIADVGAGAFEEVNWQPAGSNGGENYGWNQYEGPDCYRPLNGAECVAKETVAPIWNYAHLAEEGGCAVVGGHVYRGTEFPELIGSYLAADVCTGRVWSLKRSGSRWTATLLFRVDTVLSSFGEDTSGEIYLVSLRGRVYRLARGSGSVETDTLSFTCLILRQDSGGWKCIAAA